MTTKRASNASGARWRGLPVAVLLLSAGAWALAAAGGVAAGGEEPEALGGLELRRIEAPEGASAADLMRPLVPTEVPGGEGEPMVPLVPSDYPSRRPPGFPPFKVPANNPVTPGKVALGERLFFESALSSDGAVSCAGCHHPDRFFSDDRKHSLGVKGQTAPNNTPTIINAAYATRLLYDGRSPSLEDQVRYPITHPREMNMNKKKVVAALEADAAYPPLFAAAYGDPAITYDRITRALASFERTLVAGDSPFDRFYFGGEEEAIPAAARRGWELFSGRGGCIDCHTFSEESPFFSDYRFHNTGVGWDKEKPDLGRYLITRDKSDRGTFRTPPLRNVAETAPYMHDGSVATLAEVVAFFNRGGADNGYLDERLRPLGLTAAEEADLVAFLETLTGPLAYEPPRELAAGAGGRQKGDAP